MNLLQVNEGRMDCFKSLKIGLDTPLKVVSIVALIVASIVASIVCSIISLQKPLPWFRWNLFENATEIVLKNASLRE